MSTYTAVLVRPPRSPPGTGAGSSPFAFAGSAAASAAGASLILTPTTHAAPARRLLVGSLATEAVAVETMTRRLGPLGEPYHHGKAGRYHQYARMLNGASVRARPRGRRRPLQRLAGALALAGSACTRFAIYEAGFDSAIDPRATWSRSSAARMGEAAVTHSQEPASPYQEPSACGRSSR